MQDIIEAAANWVTEKNHTVWDEYRQAVLAQLSA